MYMWCVHCTCTCRWLHLLLKFQVCLSRQWDGCPLRFGSSSRVFMSHAHTCTASPLESWPIPGQVLPIISERESTQHHIKHTVPKQEPPTSPNLHVTMPFKSQLCAHNSHTDCQWWIVPVHKRERSAVTSKLHSTHSDHTHVHIYLYMHVYCTT